jgi:enamine deaminase RidA (YjgF/YER057c/UK114 family)
MMNGSKESKFMKVALLFSIFCLMCGTAIGAPSFDPEKRLSELNIKLYSSAASSESHVKAVRTGNIIYLSGHGPQKADGTRVVGKVGRDLDIPHAQEAAKLAAINLLSTLKAEIGELKKVRRIIKVFGMVNTTDDFKDQPKVINGASDFLVAVFGEERGKHARSAVGVASLRGGAPVEIEMVVEVDPKR